VGENQESDKERDEMKPTEKCAGQFWWGKDAKFGNTPQVYRISWDETFGCVVAFDAYGGWYDYGHGIEWLGPCPMPMSEDEARSLSRKIAEESWEYNADLPGETAYNTLRAVGMVRRDV